MECSGVEWSKVEGVAHGARTPEVSVCIGEGRAHIAHFCLLPRARPLLKTETLDS